jgi:hypothetical protein
MVDWNPVKCSLDLAHLMRRTADTLRHQAEVAKALECERIAAEQEELADAQRRNMTYTGSYSGGSDLIYMGPTLQLVGVA